MLNICTFKMRTFNVKRLEASMLARQTSLNLLFYLASLPKLLSVEEKV